jgi:20S proteasome alpha/beta subunit
VLACLQPKPKPLVPLKHKRYPLSRGGIVTITAGFVHNGGVLLCSDSQIEIGSQQKSWGRKIGSIVHEWGGIAGAVAGNSDYGTCAFQSLELRASEGPLTLVEIEELLKGAYEENVFRHPFYLTHPMDYWYSLLLAVSLPGMDRPKLYLTNEATLREVTTYRCEGIGREVGHTVLKPLWKPDMDLDSLMRLSAYMLAVVKNNVPGCGGPSQFANVGLFGVPRVANGNAMDVLHIENVYGWFDQVSSEFLLKHMCESDQDFETYLGDLQKHARRIRGIWKKQIKVALKEARKVPKHGRKSQQPSPG